MLLPVALMVCLLVLSLTGCGNKWKRFVVYEPFKGEYTTDRFDVSCDWETINPLLAKCDFEANNEETEPDYLGGYRAVYSLDGELTLEEGSWFIDEDNDKFCNYYLEIMLEIIGEVH